jgi:hypothetical protein
VAAAGPQAGHQIATPRSPGFLDDRQAVQTTPRPAETASEPLLNRELSWLDLNGRVLHLAADPDQPLLERVKFCGIFSTNLDARRRPRRLVLEVNGAVDFNEAYSLDGEIFSAVRSALLGTARRPLEPVGFSCA